MYESIVMEVAMERSCMIDCFVCEFESDGCCEEGEEEVAMGWRPL